MLNTKDGFDIEPKPGLFPDRDTQHRPLAIPFEDALPPKRVAMMSEIKITYPKNGLYGLL